MSVKDKKSMQIILINQQIKKSACFIILTTLQFYRSQIVNRLETENINNSKLFKIVVKCNFHKLILAERNLKIENMQ